MAAGKINIHGIYIDIVNYSDILSAIKNSVNTGKQISIGYANANTINLSYSHKDLPGVFSKFDVVHPDGIGIFIGSKILFGKKGLKQRITGSDMYPMLAETAIKNKWRIFFFGHDDATLQKISLNLPQLKIAGLQNGYTYNDEEVINEVNKSECDILIAGLGSPKQALWVSSNRDRLNCKAILCVGNGIKVFAGIKNRGPEFIRKTGLEWLFRYTKNPVRYFRRYIIGNPLFLYRIIILKIRKLAQ